MRGGECFAGHVLNPVPELVITRRDETTPLSIKGVADSEFGVAAVTVMGEVCGV